MFVPPNKSECLAMGIAMPVTTGFIVALRLYARRNRTRYGIDDLFAVISYAFCLAIAIAMIHGCITSGLGNTSAEGVLGGFAASGQLVVDTRKYTEIANWASPPGLMFSKLSALFFFRRIFFGRTFNVVSWAAIIMVAFWGIICFFLTLLQCGPHVGILLFGTAKGIADNCWPGLPIGLSYAASDVFTDFVVISIPIYWTMKLQMNTAKKIVVLAIFLFGSIAVLASILRMAIDIIIYPGHNSNPDQLGYLTCIVYFLELESGLALIAACLPTFGTLISEERRERLSSSLNSRFSRKTRTTSEVELRAESSASSPKGLASPLPLVPNTVLAQHADIETVVIGHLDYHLNDDSDQRIFVVTDTKQSSQPVSAQRGIAL